MVPKHTTVSISICATTDLLRVEEELVYLGISSHAAHDLKMLSVASNRKLKLTYLKQMELLKLIYH